MNYADSVYNNLILDIHENGTWDKDDIRAKYADETPAYSKSVFGRQIDFRNNTMPLLTTKKVFSVTATKELLLFWVHQTVKEKDFKEHNVKIWDEWFINGDLGRSYAYQFESRRHTKDEHIQIQPLTYEIPLEERKAELIYGIGYLGNPNSVKNFSKEERDFLFHTWKNMIYFSYVKQPFSVDTDKFVCKEWHSFENFLRAVRYLPQFFLAKEDNFNDWVLSTSYYQTNCYSPESVVWIKIGYDTECKILNYKKDYTRLKLSSNQVVDLLNQIKNNPNSRRLMTSFWSDSDVDKKNLQECAWATEWNVRDSYLDLILIQRSADFGLGISFNWIQYWILLQMVAHVSSLKPGDFIHQIGNAHYYDRHEEALLNQVNNASHSLPTFSLNEEVIDFFDFEYTDLKFINYVSGPSIPMEVAI